jgi:hypothetical protein
VRFWQFLKEKKWISIVSYQRNLKIGQNLRVKTIDKLSGFSRNTIFAETRKKNCIKTGANF